MLKILAVSDSESPGLETMVSRFPEKLRDIDVIISCGDLEREYLEFLVDGINRDLFFVSGNHQQQCEEDIGGDNPVERLLQSLRAFPEKLARCIAGQSDLHGRVVTYKNYIIAGFGGSMWYSGRGNEYSEREMAKTVRQVERKIQLFKLRQKILNRPPYDLIIISHAPIFRVHDEPDLCHKGFKCFRDFVENMSPLLWLHGHIHLDDVKKHQITVVGKTTVVNVFGHKFVAIDNDKIEVSLLYTHVHNIS